MSAHAGAKVTDSVKQCEGQIVNGLPIRQYLGGRAGNAVFSTEYSGKKAAIKLLAVDPNNVDSQLARLNSQTKLSHPHLIRTLSTGKCRINNEDKLYVVTDFADEDLSQVIPARALTNQEAQQMLASVVHGLEFLHDRGFVHGHIKPSNTMVVGEQIKLSTDGMYANGERFSKSHSTSRYSAPEPEASPAADMWSLGMMLVEALTQRVPVLTEPDPLVPAAVPEPFQQIARNCLRGDPAQRWTIQQVKKCLQPKPAAVPSAAPAKSSRTWVYAVAAVIVVLLALTVGPKLMRHSEEPPATEAANSAATASADGPRQPAVATSSSTSASGSVLHEVVPDVSKSARNTIHGIIKLRVKADADKNGNVTRTLLETAGPSKYFARLAVEASQRWKFTPPRQNGNNVPSAWMLHYEFTRAGVRAQATPIERR
jgi:serine/threonine protein kinase